MDASDFDLSEDTIKWIRQEFQNRDTEGSGKIPTSELGDWLRQVGFNTTEEDEDFLQQCFDQNGDGYLQIEEIIANLRTVQAHSIHGEEIKKAFAVFDRDGDGCIRLAEMKQILCMNNFMSAEEAGKLISVLVEKFDRNRDGKFSYSEFVEIFCSDLLPMGSTANEDEAEDASKAAPASSKQPGGKKGKKKKAN